jgi:hypothetical protein
LRRNGLQCRSFLFGKFSFYEEKQHGTITATDRKKLLSCASNNPPSQILAISIHK